MTLVFGEADPKLFQRGEPLWLEDHGEDCEDCEDQLHLHALDLCFTCGHGESRHRSVGCMADLAQCACREFEA